MPVLLGKMESIPKKLQLDEAYVTKRMRVEEDIGENETIIGVLYGRLKSSRFHHMDRLQF